MKNLGALLLAAILFTIMVGGSYSKQEVVQISIQVIPTPLARPTLVGSSLAAYTGIHSARLSKENNRFDVTYDKARISLDDLSHILTSLGYRVVPLEEVKSAM